jgi:hypothetical protein
MSTSLKEVFNRDFSHLQMMLQSALQPWVALGEAEAIAYFENYKRAWLIEGYRSARRQDALKDLEWLATQATSIKPIVASSFTIYPPIMFKPTSKKDCHVKT